jgi:hypothetical protein
LKKAAQKLLRLWAGAGETSTAQNSKILRFRLAIAPAGSFFRRLC